MKTLVAWFLLAAAAPPVAGQPMDAAQTSDFLARLASTQSDGRATLARFREVRTGPLLAEAAVAEGTIDFLAPGRFRREVRGERGSLAVSDGETLWLFFPQFSEVEVYPLGGRGPGAAAAAAIVAGLSFVDAEKNFDAEAERIGDGFRVTLVPKSRAQRSVLARVGVEIGRDLRVRSATVEQTDGTVSEITFLEVQRRTVPEDRFRFEPPPGTRVTKPLG